MTFDQWLSQVPVKGYRRGQQLFNTAPDHITAFAAGDLLLDPFQCDNNKNDPTYPRQMAQIERFVTFAKLCWDTTDEEEMKAARLLIWREM